MRLEFILQRIATPKVNSSLYQLFTANTWYCSIIVLSILCTTSLCHGSSHARTHTRTELNANVITGFSFQFVLSQSKTTSAGIYDTDGKKVRDLWGGRVLNAGTYLETWDGRSDDGNVLPNRQYEVKLLHHNLRFEYTNLFNAGERPTGIGSYFQLRKPTSVRASNAGVVWFPGYNEGACGAFLSPASGELVFQELVPYFHQWVTQDGDVDNAFAYISVRRSPFFPDKPQDIFLLKYSIETRAPVKFTGSIPDSYSLSSGSGPAGSNYGGYALNIGTNSAVNDSSYLPARVAVMKNGPLIAVSLPNANRVLIYDKTSGRIARHPITVDSPTAIAWTRNETHLIVATNDKILCSYRDTGRNMLFTQSIDCKSVIVDLASDPTTGVIAVALSRPKQQIVAFEPLRLRERWRLGEAGGYASTSIVSSNRFHFMPTFNGGSLSFDGIGRLWVYDRALFRIQRFPRPRESDSSDRVMHASDSYSFAADKGDPSRLIANLFLGYRRNWSKPNRPGFGGGGAWELDRFWGYDFVDRFNVSANDALTHVHTVNGRLYGYIRVGEIYRKTVELTDFGVREVGEGGPKVFGWDESFNRVSVAHPDKVVIEQFLGLDKNYKPQWSAPQLLAVFDPENFNDPFPTPGQTPSSTEYPILGGRVITTYQLNDGSVNRYHIGALNSDGTWQWRHGKGLVASIPFPTDGRTTIHGNAYAIGGLWATGEFAVLSWNGEFFDGGQAGKHLIYNRDGLYVGQVGQSSFPTTINANYIPMLGANGNALHGSLLFAGGKYRYLHSTESQSSGILEWTFENMESYGILSGMGSYGAKVELGRIPESDGEPMPPGNVTFEDEFSRGDSAEVGNGWQLLSGSVKVGIVEGNLVARPGVIHRVFENIVYRKKVSTDSCQIIRIPISFFPPQAFGLTNANGFMSEFGVVARLQPSAQSMIIAFVRYDRSPTGMDGNGSIGLELLATVNGRRYSIGKLRAKYLPESPGSAYQLRLVVSGEIPTRVEAVLFDESQNREVLRAYTELWEPQLSQGGYGGISIGLQDVRVDRYEERQFTWPVR